jgi:starch synthase (maltosyl-transferring)
MVGLVAGRFGLSDVSPVVAGGLYPARAVVGEAVPVAATVFREGHDAVATNVTLTGPDGKVWPFIRMTPGAPGLDRWHATMTPNDEGMWTFVVEAWSDPLHTWHHAVTVKIDAGQEAGELSNDLLTGAELFGRLAEQVPAAQRAAVQTASARLRDGSRPLRDRVALALSDEIQRLARDYPLRELITTSPTYELWVDRTRALFGAWYEFFPRSVGAELSDDPATPAKPLRHGTLVDSIKHLDYVADMGFDVVYLPPIHPIGYVNRKGANNTLDPRPWDVGSPWAIGSAEGGHDAIHPQLGTEADLAAFVARTRELGMEVALDYALQAAPDHPWVTSHPEWFTTKPDGSIAYAENPPKKYQDIYPLNFDNDPDGLYRECYRVLKKWVDMGIRIFRVDNPHTKPINFWHWLIWKIKETDPDVLFLAEAFTRPAMMHALAQLGFTQSYTYFTWRNSKHELTEYLRDLVATAHYMRPNFFANTPDILHEYLQHGVPAAFTIRAVLAATLSPTYGIYSGYEFFEHVPLREGSEEYLNSEKYQLRPRDFSDEGLRGSLVPLLARLNGIRHDHRALHDLRNLTFHHADDDSVIAYSKRDPLSGDTVLVICSLDPHHTRESFVRLDMPALGVGWNDGIEVLDLLRGDLFSWAQHNFVRLTTLHPAHIFAVRPVT